MSGFHDVQLPLALAFGATGGPERMADIARLASGDENRNARWAGSRRRWEAGGAVMTLDLAHDLVTFFEARRGRLYGFRFRDPIDCKSCAPSLSPAATDQPLGTGDGATATFQLIKRYVSGGGSWDRAIAKPIAGSVVVAVAGAPTTAFDVDSATGAITFHDPPTEGAVLTAGFEFDTPVRFDVDRLEVSLEGHDAARITRASLVEITG
jgi:uncharacterized protein (TIGR02217 family)